MTPMFGRIKIPGRPGPARDDRLVGGGGGCICGAGGDGGGCVAKIQKNKSFEIIWFHLEK